MVFDGEWYEKTMRKKKSALKWYEKTMRIRFFKEIKKVPPRGGQNFMKIQVFQKVFHHFGTPGAPRGAQNFNDFHVFHKVLQYFGGPWAPRGAQIFMPLPSKRTVGMRKQ